MLPPGDLVRDRQDGHENRGGGGQAARREPAGYQEEQHEREDPRAEAIGSPKPHEPEDPEELVHPPEDGEEQDPGDGDRGRRGRLGGTAQHAEQGEDAQPGERRGAHDPEVRRAPLGPVEPALPVRPCGQQAPVREPVARGRDEQLEGLQGVPLQVPVGARGAWVRALPPLVDQGARVVGEEARDQDRGERERGEDRRARGPTGQLRKGGEEEELGVQAGEVRVVERRHHRDQHGGQEAPGSQRNAPPAEGPRHDQHAEGQVPAHRQIEVRQAAPEQEVPEPVGHPAGERPRSPRPEVAGDPVEGQGGQDVGEEKEEVQGGEEPHRPREASPQEKDEPQRAGVVVPARLERRVQLGDDERSPGKHVAVARGLEVGGQEERVPLVGDRRPPRREAGPAVGDAPHRHHDEDEDAHKGEVPPARTRAPDPHTSVSPLLWSRPGPSVNERGG